MKRLFSKLLPPGWNHSIGLKLGAVISALGAGISLFIFIFIFIFIYFPPMIEREALNTIAAKATTIAQMTAYSLSPALVFGDEEAAHEVFRSAKQNKDLVYLVAQDGRGGIFAALGRTRAEKARFMEVESGDHLTPDGAVYRTMVPIAHDGNEVGRLYLGLSLRQLQAEINQGRKTMAIISLFVFVMGLIAAFSISTVITRPLGQIVKTVGQIAAGDLTRRAVVFSKDEVGKLARAFNIMVDHLESTLLELENLNRSLEQRVAERTRALRDEINERKRAEEERMRAEEELRQALEKEKELGQLKSRFVAMASHEFRTPLTTILASSDLLKRYGHRMSDDEKVQRLDKIQVEVRHMTQLLEDVLTMGKAEAGRVEFQPMPLDLEAFCRDLIEEVQTVTRGTHLIDFSSRCGEASVIMDQKLLRHILNNLLFNAVKYSSRGSTVCFGLECVNGKAVFRVRDEGIGIPTEDQKRLFEPFHRAKNVGTISGTGLGLAIAKKSVELHGGRITFESQPQIGTTFTVMIPVAHETGERLAESSSSRRYTVDSGRDSHYTEI